MTNQEIDQSLASELMLAVGNVDHLRLVQGAYMELIYTLLWSVGGAIDSVTFLSDLSDASAAEHRVYWLRGNAIGCLVVGAHQGAEGDPNAKLNVTGYTRSIADIRRLELRDVQIEWTRWGARVPELRPTLAIHFDDMEIIVDVASRTEEKDRKQAVAFIDRLQAVFARTA